MYDRRLDIQITSPFSQWGLKGLSTLRHLPPPTGFLPMYGGAIIVFYLIRGLLNFRSSKFQSEYTHVTTKKRDNTCNLITPKNISRKVQNDKNVNYCVSLLYVGGRTAWNCVRSAALVLENKSRHTISFCMLMVCMLSARARSPIINVRV